MYRISLLFLLLVNSSYHAFGQKNPFDTLEYDLVVAFEFQGNGNRTIMYCLENEPARINKRDTLAKQDVGLFEKIITKNSNYGAITAACFDPHLAIVYLLQNKMVAVIDVCLDCNYLTSSVEIPAVQKIINQTPADSLPLKGFSKKGRKEIRDFAEKLGFTRYLKEQNAMFDQ